MLKKFYLVFLCLCAITYLAGLLNQVFAFILFLVILFYSSVFLFFFAIWKIYFTKSNKSFKRNIVRFLLSLSGYFILFLLGREAINHYYLENSYSIFRISVKIALLLLTFFLWFNYARRKLKKTTIICTILYMLFIISAPFISIFYPKPSIPDASPKVNRLVSLPYLDWSHTNDIEKVSVTQHDPSSSYKGFNLYTSVNLGKVFLFDMEGDTINVWSPGSQKKYLFSEICKNGDLLSISKDNEFVRVDWNSNNIWTANFRPHHDFDLFEDGQIYSLARKDSVFLMAGLPIPILEDYIAVLSPEGKLTKEITFLSAIKNELSINRITRLFTCIVKPSVFINIIKNKLAGKYLLESNTIFDIMHANSIELLRKDIPGFGEIDDILISVREINLVFVFDVKQNKAVWKWGPGIIDKQHHPTVLDNDNILIYDNGAFRRYTRILELNPQTKKIVWDYTAEPKEDFFSSNSGSQQRLPNGNTLISESTKGRAFEITQNGKIVWEFYNPNIIENTQEREIIYRMTRIIDIENYPPPATTK